ncbi:DUF4287 domain-containing protein [Emticicia sp. CRIBPO]|uniref:DUF4287 domain-containing protein n=1 Tax=Emticicia sp. CRIBPO TaxID=2683258 RepID=UPI0014135023|nr:DUF4287 domain-containing protein [Emticicia sp. CRIBPO]NBA86680.1 DUF4287 domain-containing protein [Emticicia sp. CRIBPO]
MSFQAYIDNIKTKTGRTPVEFKDQLEKAGLLTPEFKAADLIKWLKENYDLGHGHSMAIWAVFKNEGWVTDKKK